MASDEVWHFYEGDPLELVWVDAADGVHRATLSGGADGVRPVAVVPAGCWQAARPLGTYTLVGCSVGPVFDFNDFEMVAPDSPDEQRLRQICGATSRLL